MTTMSLPSSLAALAGPRPVRWTCAEFHRFGDMGVFEGRRAMLIDGVILEEGPMNPPHALTLEVVEATLRTTFRAGWRIRMRSEWSSMRCSSSVSSCCPRSLWPPSVMVRGC